MQRVTWTGLAPHTPDHLWKRIMSLYRDVLSRFHILSTCLVFTLRCRDSTQSQPDRIGSLDRIQRVDSNESTSMQGKFTLTSMFGIQRIELFKFNRIQSNFFAHGTSANQTTLDGPSPQTASSKLPSEGKPTLHLA